MKSGQRLTKAQKAKIKADYLVALNRSAGIMGPALKAVGLNSRTTIWQWRKEDPEFDAACQEANETALDMAESALYKNINAGDTNAIKFLLSCKGKDRGYVDRQQIDLNATITRPRIVYEDDTEAVTHEPELDE